MDCSTIEVMVTGVTNYGRPIVLVASLPEPNSIQPQSLGAGTEPVPSLLVSQIGSFAAPIPQTVSSFTEVKVMGAASVPFAVSLPLM